MLSDLYGCMNIGQSVIFMNSKHEAHDLATRMKVMILNFLLPC